MEFLSPEDFDHYLAFIKLSQEMHYLPKPFKYSSCWSKHVKFLSTVQASWNVLIEGSPMMKESLMRTTLLVF